MATHASHILKPPRIVLIIVFPTLTLLLYLLLTISCLTPSLTYLAPITVESKTGSTTPITLRIGFFGICLTPQLCLPSTPLRPVSSGNSHLFNSASSIQSSLLPSSGLPLLLILIISLFANLIQINFSARGIHDLHAKSSLWARCMEWAAASASLVAFVAFHGTVDGIKKLLRVNALSGGVGGNITVEVGGEAGRLFAAVAGMSMAGAVVNTWLMGDDLMDWKREKESEERRMRMSRMRAGYEVFP
ncbi:hypothetical protein QBC38DRAFT_239136 [Podospora fimiseda]|uniref:Uncharacterized protein n=1 Tax=Podospora fimiseda TaxID=252190 RepID=A0AAN7GX06_9PEZI|nr:hypothetical protein QBC38DRAFT_239136 [Podospora fimiseda]